MKVQGKPERIQFTNGLKHCTRQVFVTKETAERFAASMNKVTSGWKVQEVCPLCMRTHVIKVLQGGL